MVTLEGLGSWDAYPKVWALGHQAISELLFDDVVIQEKLDGSQFSFGLIDGKLRVRSRGREFDPEAPDKIFAPACATVLTLAELNMLTPEYTYRGETLASSKHNMLKYDRVPRGNIVLFDINTGMQSFMAPADVQLEAERLGLEPVPSLWLGCGSFVTMETLRSWLTKESILGGTQVEGVVIKNYHRFGRDSKALMGKLVREEFKEQMKQARPKNRKDMVVGLVETYRTEARWAKAVQHLREEGRLLDEPKDIGPLMKEIQTDLLEEEGEAIKEALFKRFWSEIARGAGRGAAEWYKLELAKSQFENEENE